MIRLKQGAVPVSLKDLQPQTVLAIVVAARIYDAAGVEPMVVTSVNDGTHKKGSLHPKGLAFDLRVSNVPMSKRHWIYQELKEALGREFDVLYESAGTPNEHIHVEYDPAWAKG